MPLNPIDYTLNYATGRGRKIDPQKSPLAFVMVQKGWTAEAMSRAVGLNYDTLLRYIRGSMRINSQHITILADALGVNPKHLDFVPVERPEIDYDIEVMKVFEKLEAGYTRQQIFDEFLCSTSSKGLVKSLIRVIDTYLREGELSSLQLTSLGSGD